MKVSLGQVVVRPGSNQKGRLVARLERLNEPVRIAVRWEDNPTQEEWLDESGILLQLPIRITVMEGENWEPIDIAFLGRPPS